VAKGRPRVALRGKYPTIYTPKETKEAEERIILQTRRQKPKELMTGPIVMDIVFFKVKPKSYSKSTIYWTKKPDIDNMIKLVLDALNGVFYVDDAQVMRITATKQYSDSARTEITIEQYGELNDDSY